MMRQISKQHPGGTFTAFRIVLIGEVITFLAASLLHTGLFGVPALFAAMIVEGLCAIACAISALAVFTRQSWAKRTAFFVQFFILAAVLLGISALARSADIRTPLNIGLHAVMLALIVAGLSLLAVPGTRKALASEHMPRSSES